MAGGREFDHRRDSTELFIHVVADVGGDEPVLAAQQRHSGDLGEQLCRLGSAQDEDRRVELPAPAAVVEQGEGVRGDVLLDVGQVVPLLGIVRNRARDFWIVVGLRLLELVGAACSGNLGILGLHG